MKNADKRQGVMLAAVLLHPRSRGSLTLASADPFQRPLIDPQILSDPEDQRIMKIGTFLWYMLIYLKNIKY